MNKLISGLLVFILVSTANGASTRTIEAVNTEGFFSSQNLVSDAGFEGNNKGAAWVASGGSFAVTSTTPARGDRHATWDASANAQTLKSKLVAIPPIMYGKNGVVSCQIKDSNGLAAYTLTASDGTNDLATATRINSSITSYIRTSVNFIFPSSGSIQVKLAATQDEVSIAFDDCYLGLADGFNLGSVSQATLIASGYIDTTASCSWTRTNTALGAFSTTSNCPGPTIELNPGPGTLQTTDTDLPKFTVNSLPPGMYRVMISGVAGPSGASTRTALAINDGTNTRGRGTGDDNTSGSVSQFTVEAWFSYTDVGNKTFELYGSSASNSVSVTAASSNAQLRFSIERYPTSTETVYRADQIGSSWSGYHDSTCSWSRTNTAYGDPAADATCALVEQTNTNFGTVTSYLSGSDKLPGLVFTPKKSQKYLVCASPTWYTGTASNFGSIELSDTDGPTTIGVTSGYNNTSEKTDQICGEYVASSTAVKTVRLRSKSGAGTAVIGNGAVTGGSPYAIVWSIIAIDQAFPAPVFVGSVTSASTGAMRVESARLASPSAGACVVSQESGDFLNGNATSAGAGRCAVAFNSGIWSSAPTCMCTSAPGVATVRPCVVSSDPTTSAAEFYVSNSGGAISENLYIMCMGPR